MPDTNSDGSVKPIASFLNINSSTWITIATWMLVGPLGIYYKALADKWSLPVPDASSLGSFLMQAVPWAVGGAISWWRRTEPAVLEMAARILAARQAPQTAAIVAQAAIDVATTSTTSSKVQSHWAIPVLIILMGLGVALGGCTATTAGTPVTVTSKNLLAVIAERLVQGCAYYNANHISVAVLTQAVEQAAKATENVKGTVDTVENLTTLTCTLLAPPPAPAPKPEG